MMSHHDSQVNHLMLALSACHGRWRNEALEQHSPEHVLPTFNQSGLGVTLGVSTQTDLGSLVSCVLLTAIHLFQGNSYTAYRCVEWGRQQLEKVLDPLPGIATEQEVIRIHLVSLISRFETSIDAGIGVYATGLPTPPAPKDSDLCFAVARNLINPDATSQGPPKGNKAMVSH